MRIPGSWHFSNRRAEDVYRFIRNLEFHPNTSILLFLIYQIEGFRGQYSQTPCFLLRCFSGLIGPNGYRFRGIDEFSRLGYWIHRIRSESWVRFVNSLWRRRFVSVRESDVEGRVRRMDGPIWKEEDRAFFHPHAVFRTRAAASGLLQEEASGQHGELLSWLIEEEESS